MCIARGSATDSSRDEQLNMMAASPQSAILRLRSISSHLQTPRGTVGMQQAAAVDVAHSYRKADNVVWDELGGVLLPGTIFKHDYYMRGEQLLRKLQSGDAKRKRRRTRRPQLFATPRGPRPSTVSKSAVTSLKRPTPSRPPANLDEARARERLEQHWRVQLEPAEWAARAARLRHGLKRRLGLEPEPPRTLLAPRMHSRVQLDGYTVECVALETVPGFYCTGNLYRPNAPLVDGQCAGMLCPHGHFGPKFIRASAKWGEKETAGRTTDEGSFESIDDDAAVGGRFRRDMQIRCATFARLGAVVFAIDMIGWGDSQQMEHTDPRVLAFQSWNATRVVDYLISLPEVDAARIGVTGASGGGTQSFLLAAIDERIACSVPVVMASAHMSGGCVCEAGLAIHQTEENADGILSNAEIAALAAPRPQMLVSVTWRESNGVRAGKRDQSCNTPEVEFPYLQNTYRLLGAEADVENVHFTQDHDYGTAKRAVVYPFLAKHLGLDLSRAPCRANGDVDESFVTVLPPSALRVWTAEHPLPSHALHGHEDVGAAFWDDGAKLND